MRAMKQQQNVEHKVHLRMKLCELAPASHHHLHKLINAEGSRKAIQFSITITATLAQHGLLIGCATLVRYLAALCGSA